MKWLAYTIAVCIIIYASMDVLNSDMSTKIALNIGGLGWLILFIMGE